jgi:hypothetical protein
MTRVEAIQRLCNGETVTHPEIAYLPLLQEGNDLYYLYEGRKLFASNAKDFFWIKQEIKWDTGWETLTPGETTSDAQP